MSILYKAIAHFENQSNSLTSIPSDEVIRVLKELEKEERKMYYINVSGCDDTTSFDFELTDQEYELVKAVCEKCTTTSTYGCQPTMTINLKSNQQ